MTKDDYAILLKHPKWQRKRLEIMQRDDFKCQKCSDEETELQVHHTRYLKDKKPWEYDDKYLITLCIHCHKEMEIIKEACRSNPENFNKVSIIKFIGIDTRIMLQIIKDCCLLSIYDKKDNRIDVFRIEKELMTKLSNTLLKSLENGRKKG